MTQSLLLGVLGSFVASILFLSFASIFRPKLSISEKISVGEYDGKNIYSIKAVNSGHRRAINIKAELQIIGTRVVKGGKGRKIYNVDLLKNNLLVLEPYKSNNSLNFSFEFSTEDDLKVEWEKIEASTLLFRIVAQDSFTSFSKVFEQEYFSVIEAIEFGRFAYGNNMSIHS